MKTFKQLAILGLFSTLNGAMTAQAQTTSPCNDGKYLTQLQMNQCAHEQYEKADKKLNVLYKKVQARQPQKASRLRFQKAQLAWLKFRDLQCEHAAMRYEGGSIMPLIRAGCLETLTLDRNSYFKKLLKDMPH